MKFVAMCHSSSRCVVNEIFALLGCYAAYVGSWLQTFRDNLSVPSSSLKMRSIGRPETSVTTNIRGVHPRGTRISYADMFVDRKNMVMFVKH